MTSTVWLGRRGLILLGAAMAIVPAAPLSNVTPRLRSFLSAELKFSERELADLEHGKIVRHLLDAETPGEIAAAGAVRIDARKDALVDGYRDIVRFKHGPGVLQIGRFSRPPAVSDLDALTLDLRDVNFRTCRPRDCDIRLPADAIARIRQDIDWTAPDAEARAGALFKQLLVDHVRAYAIGGPGRITQYDDDKRPIRPADAFASMLAESPFIGALVPGLDAHLRDVPVRALAGTEDLFYWSKETFGLSSFITVTQITIGRDAAGDDIMTSKDVYSSRYLDASLTLTIASDSVGSADAYYLVYVNRTSANALKGPLAGLRHAIAARRARSSLEDSLRDLKRRLEIESRD